MTKNIELEFRAELKLNQFKKILLKLNKEYKLISHSKRLSIMFLGEINESDFDIRIRINDKNESELVIKRGAFHAHDRIEFSQIIKKDQIIGLAKLFSLFNFNSKITERENFVFDVKDGVEITLVKAGSIAYLEIEKMSSDKNLNKNKEKLIKIISEMGLKIINEAAFNKLCNRLSRYSDIKFNNSSKDFRILKKILINY